MIEPCVGDHGLGVTQLVEHDKPCFLWIQKSSPCNAMNPLNS